MSATVLSRITLILAFVGLFIAGVLSLSHVLNVVPPCGGGMGCARVATHPSSKWGGIPVAYFGFGAYLSLAALAWARTKAVLGRPKLLIQVGWAISAIGTLVSVYLTYYAITEIRATCIWCIASAITMALIFFAHALLAMAPDEVTPVRLDLRLPWVLVATLVLALGVEGKLLRDSARVNPLGGSNAYLGFDRAFFVPVNAHMLGPPRAAVTIVEFGDLMCPSCKKDYPELLDLMDKHQGRLRWVFRHFPLYKTPGHEMSYLAAEASEIANEKGKFWDFLAAAYGLPQESVHDAGPYLAILDTFGFDRTDSLNRLAAVKPGEPLFERVFSDADAGRALGVKLTPTFFVLAKGVNPLPCTFTTLKAALEEEPYAHLLGPAAAGGMQAPPKGMDDGAGQ
ncbi:MAG: thioredoxin domain-containing protein [Fimbriimonas ginsengisoli]|uniref:Thioredoxin domain-containing protein n=1 Tax=Fimbriimonas ginsengisoli TaxID=1005039 RepID=A0A931LTS4_FIMGI|nr:thioredoxin domain-containing protein [Fimbriimonas ginsengisoli]